MKRSNYLFLLILCLMVSIIQTSCTQEAGILEEKELRVTDPILFVETGKTAAIEIEGNGGYTIKNGNTEIFTATLEGNRLVVNGLKEGSAYVSITDKDGLYLSLEVIVGDIGSRQTDSLALIDLYSNTSPDKWAKRWQINFPIQYWEGVTVNEEGRVIGLDLNANGLNGKLPASISKLFYLKTLDLSSNKFTNELPPEISKLINLTKLRLVFMKGLTVNPQTIEELTRLKSLDTLGLMDIYLTAPMKPILDKFENLKSLELGFYNQNRFPLEVCNIKGLEALEIWNGNFGTIPAELSKLTHLKRLVMPNDGITGEIPPEIGRMSNLEVLNLSENKLVGSVPETFNQLSKLHTLVLYQNELTALPADMSGMQSLQYITVRNNKLRSPLPKLDGLNQLRYIGLEYNEIPGVLPSSWSTLSALRDLKLNYNRITGEIPVTYGAFENLRILNLSNNNITGTVPVSFANFKAKFEGDFFTIDLRSNKMSGVLDQQLRSHPMYLNDKWIFSPQQSGYGFDDIEKVVE